jgi:hypothetical protein
LISRIRAQNHHQIFKGSKGSINLFQGKLLRSELELSVVLLEKLGLFSRALTDSSTQGFYAMYVRERRKSGIKWEKDWC